MTINRVTQSIRQPGSSFKPFIYSAALEKGFMTSTIINDAPIILDPVKAMLGLSTAEAATRPARGRHQDHPCPPRRW